MGTQRRPGSSSSNPYAVIAWLLGIELTKIQALPLLKAAYDRGINTVSFPLHSVCFSHRIWLYSDSIKWDTANVYSNGQSEIVMGKALSTYNIPRSKVVLMTKCFRVVCDPETYDVGSGVTMHHDLADQSKEYVNHWGNWPIKFMSRSDR